VLPKEIIAKIDKIANTFFIVFVFKISKFIVFIFINY